MAERNVELARDGQRATVSLEGGRLASYNVSRQELLANHQDPAGPNAYCASLLAPWPNRIADGRWEWEGEAYQLEVNDIAAKSALHGLVSKSPFVVETQSSEHVLLSHRLAPTPGYPFRLEVRAFYHLDGAGLTCYLEAENLDERPAPVGLGVHPYIAAPERVDEVVLTLPARTRPVLDKQWREIGRRSVGEAGCDFRGPRPLGNLTLDAAFTDLVRTVDDRVEVVFALPGGPEVILWSGSTCCWLVVYTGDTLPPAERRRSIAVEPMTCGANAFVTGKDLDVLAPGAALRLDWGLLTR